jgi:hypothetical protein
VLRTAKLVLGSDAPLPVHRAPQGTLRRLARRGFGAGIDHVGYALASFDDLVATYTRLKANGITPFLHLNHGFTTSLYYHDPDGNEVALNVDNFSSKAECNAFVESERMAEIGKPPYGYTFDPEELVSQFRAGAPRHELARLGIPEDR